MGNLYRAGWKVPRLMGGNIEMLGGLWVQLIFWQTNLGAKGDFLLRDRGKVRVKARERERMNKSSHELLYPPVPAMALGWH